MYFSVHVLCFDYLLMTLLLLIGSIYKIVIWIQNIVVWIVCFRCCTVIVNDIKIQGQRARTFVVCYCTTICVWTVRRTLYILLSSNGKPQGRLFPAFSYCEGSFNLRNNVFHPEPDVYTLSSSIYPYTSYYSRCWLTDKNLDKR